MGKKLEEDREQADLLLVMGTSLAVAPISKVMGWLPFQVCLATTIPACLSAHSAASLCVCEPELRSFLAQIPQLLVNRDAVAPPRPTSDGFDVSLIGNADEVVAHLAHAAGIPITDAKSSTKSSTQAVAARGPDAVCARGAVWAPPQSSGAAAAAAAAAVGAFVAKATEQLKADAEDEELVETISCDACETVMGAGDPVWTCRCGFYRPLFCNFRVVLRLMESFLCGLVQRVLRA